MSATVAMSDNAPTAALPAVGDMVAILFDPDRYLQEYPDVAWSGVDPFMPFMVYGFREGRRAR